MTQSSAAWSKRTRHLLIGFATATVVAYWIFQHVLWADLDTQRRVAAVLGVAALIGGSAWIAGLAVTPLQDRRTWWLAMFSPLGAIQAIAGFGLLLWVAGFERYLFPLALVSLACFLVFMLLLIATWVRR